MTASIDAASDLDLYELETLLDEGNADEVRRRVEQHLKLAIDVDERAHALQYLGAALVELNLIEEARVALEQSYDLHCQRNASADIIEVLLEQAEIELDERNYSAAERLLGEANARVQAELETEPADEIAAGFAAQGLDVLLATADLHLRRNTAEEGVAIAHQAVDLAESLQDPRVYFAYELLGQLLFERNDSTDGVHDFELAGNALECALASAPDALERAECCLLLLRVAEAKNDVQEVLRWREALYEACNEAETQHEAPEVLARIRDEAASLCLSAEVQA